MNIKHALQKLTGRGASCEPSEEAFGSLAPANEIFPIIRAEEVDQSRYRKIPLDSIAALGTAFAALPASARTITQTLTKELAVNQPLFIGFTPSDAAGFLRMNEFGTSGNIFHVNKQGKQVIQARMRFKPIDTLPQQETVQTIMPFDPTSMLIAAALLRLEQKLNQLQKSVDDVLQFLTLDKQSKQRGSLNTLAEILDEYKQNPTDEKRCALRNVEVQAIRREAQQNLIFYQEQISRRLQQQQVLHSSRHTQTLLSAVMSEFQEYQLACYLYGYSSYLDVLLRRDFRTEELHAVVARMDAHRQRYSKLYQMCRSRLIGYQRASLDSRLICRMGQFVKSAGQTLSNVPVIRDSPVDDALIDAGMALGKHNHESIVQVEKRFEPFSENYIDSFVEQFKHLEVLYHHKNGMLTDGESLFLLDIS